MKKHLTKLILLSLFLTGTATQCGDDTNLVPNDIPCLLKEVELFHWDNAGELPAEPLGSRIPKEAYMLEIRISTEIAEDEVESYYSHSYTRYVLSDPIEKIQIFTETAFNESFPTGADVTACFSDYPKTIDGDQLRDYTANGTPILGVDKTNRIFKTLMTIPQPGEYRFRVLLTTESGETIERVSESVSLY